MENQEEKRIAPLDSSNVQEVIGLLLPPQTSQESSIGEILVGSPGEVLIKPDPASVCPINISSVTLADTGLSLVEPVDLVADGEAIQLEDGSTAFVHSLSEESAQVLPKFFDGQAVQLEDGTTAYIHSAPREGLHAVQLEDGTTAYISSAPPQVLFEGDSTSLGIEGIENAQGSDQESEKEVQTAKTISTSKHSSVRSSSSAMGEKSFKCEFEGCGRFYSTQHHLKVHERSHTGDRPFTCKVYGCMKTFTTSYGLKSHMRVHTGETPYKCPDKNCSKAFKTSGDLQKHVRIHTGERPFKCPFEGCDRAFTTSNIQKVHIRTHTGERPYLCKEEGCGRAFASATNFKNHIRIHTGEKPYACSVIGCGKRFTEYSSLYKHHVVHTHNKPYTCSICGRHYRQTSTLSMHKRTMHGIVDAGEEDNFEPSIILDNNSIDVRPEETDLPDRETLRKKTRLRPSLETTDDILIDDDSSHGEGDSNGQHYVVVTLPADMLALQQLAKDARLGQLTTNADGSISLQVSKTVDVDSTSCPVSPLNISNQDGTLIESARVEL